MLLQDSQINQKPKGVLVGLGKQATDLYPAISESADIVAGVDPYHVKSDAAPFPIFKGLEEVLTGEEIELAVVAVPHHVHATVTSQLVAHGITVLKEKPLASSLPEAHSLKSVVLTQRVPVLTLVQRAYEPIFRLIPYALDWIGTPYWYSCEYHAAIPGVTSGWRAERDKARGGVLLDMGYHSLDRLVQTFGAVTNASGLVSYCYPEMAEQGLEDACSATLEHTSGVHGTLSVSRHNYEKAEHLKILGTEGALVISKNSLRVFGRGGEELQHLTTTIPQRKVNAQMFRSAIDLCRDWDTYSDHLAHHMRIMAAIDSIYGSCTHAKSNGNPVDGRNTYV